MSANGSGLSDIIVKLIVVLIVIVAVLILMRPDSPTYDSTGRRISEDGQSVRASARGTTEGVPHYAPQATNIRSGPNTTYHVVSSLTPGEVVYIGTPDGNGWSAVLRDGDTVGYVLGRLLRSGYPSREARSGGSAAGREVALRVSVSNMTESESQALGSPEVWLRGEGWWRPDLTYGGDVTTFEGRKLGTSDTLKFYPFGTSGPEMIVVIAVDGELCPQGCARDMVNFEIWEERFLAWGSPIDGHEIELRR